MGNRVVGIAGAVLVIQSGAAQSELQLVKIARAAKEIDVPRCPHFPPGRDGISSDNGVSNAVLPHQFVDRQQNIPKFHLRLALPWALISDGAKPWDRRPAVWSLCASRLMVNAISIRWPGVIEARAQQPA
jgi:hypothetical protein